MLNPLDGHDYFPPEFVSPKLKEENDYGLQYAKAMYNCSSRYGGQYYFGASDHDALVEVAQGRQSIANLQKLFGFYSDPSNPIADGTSSLAFMDIKVLNLAPKYVNRAVAKMQRIGYDFGLEAIDIVSIREKEDYVAALDAFYRMKKWTVDMGFDPQAMFPEIDISSLPKYPDEMAYDIAVNAKLKREIAGELFIQLLHSINNFSQKMREVDWDLVVIGRAHFYTYHDNNGIPRVRRINPKFWIGSYVDNDDFEEQEYAGFFDFISVNQFIKETSGEIPLDKQLEIVQAHCNNGPHGSFVDYKRLENYDGLGYIPVLRFYFRSEDSRSYVVKPNQFGSDIIVEKAYNYSPPSSVSERFNENGDSRVVKNSYTSIYGGTWVIDSDLVYGYGRKNYPRQNLVDATLPIKTFATNFKEGRVVSFASQMIEPLYMINTAWNKIKQILAEGRMGVMEIDFTQIEEIAMGKGGKEWSPLEVMKFLFKKNILIKRGKVNQYDQKVSNAIEMNTGGLQLSDYFTAFTTGIQMLEQMTGTSLIESTNLPDRLAVKNAEMSQETADIDMEYLINGHEYLAKRTTHQMLLLGQQSLADNKVIEGFIPSLGKVNTGFFSASKNLAYCEYGMFMTRKPTPQEWALFYNDISIALQEGRIGPADSAFVREIDNMKQARQILAIREHIHRRQVQEEAMAANQMQMQANEQQATMSLTAELEKIREQGRVDQELEILKGKIQEQLLKGKSSTDIMKTSMMERNKRVISKQKSSDDVIKQGVRNIPEKLKVMEKAQSEVLKSDTALVIAKENAKAKAKAKPATKK